MAILPLASISGAASASEQPTVPSRLGSPRANEGPTAAKTGQLFYPPL